MALWRRRRSSVERLKELVREALEQQPPGSSRTIGCEPSNRLGAVIIDARPEDGQALLWIRGGPDDPRPALLQAMVPLDHRPIEMLPQGNRSTEADEEAQRAAPRTSTSSLELAANAPTGRAFPR